jgi:hypothetical protein
MGTPLLAYQKGFVSMLDAGCWMQQINKSTNHVA